MQSGKIESQGKGSDNLDVDKNRSIIKTQTMPDPVIRIRMPHLNELSCSHALDPEGLKKNFIHKQARLRKKNNDREFVRSIRARELALQEANNLNVHTDGIYVTKKFVREIDRVKQFNDDKTDQRKKIEDFIQSSENIFAGALAIRRKRRRHLPGRAVLDSLKIKQQNENIPQNSVEKMQTNHTSHSATFNHHSYFVRKDDFTVKQNYLHEEEVQQQKLKQQQQQPHQQSQYMPSNENVHEGGGDRRHSLSEILAKKKKLHDHVTDTVRDESQRLFGIEQMKRQQVLAYLMALEHLNQEKIRSVQESQLKAQKNKRQLKKDSKKYLLIENEQNSSHIINNLDFLRQYYHKDTMKNMGTYYYDNFSEMYELQKNTSDELVQQYISMLRTMRGEIDEQETLAIKKPADGDQQGENQGDEDGKEERLGLLSVHTPESNLYSQAFYRYLHEYQEANQVQQPENSSQFTQAMQLLEDCRMKNLVNQHYIRHLDSVLQSTGQRFFKQNTDSRKKNKSQEKSTELGQYDSSQLITYKGKEFQPEAILNKPKKARTKSNLVEGAGAGAGASASAGTSQKKLSLQLPKLLSPKIVVSATSKFNLYPKYQESENRDHYEALLQLSSQCDSLKKGNRRMKRLVRRSNSEKNSNYNKITR